MTALAELDEINKVSGAVVSAAVEVHRTLGPGLLEKIYTHCLCKELSLRGLETQREVPVPLHYKGELLSHNLRLDLLVGGRVVVEVKAVETIHPVYVAQTLSYLRLTAHRVALLLNFKVPLMKEGGIQRLVL